MLIVLIVLMCRFLVAPYALGKDATRNLSWGAHILGLIVIVVPSLSCPPFPSSALDAPLPTVFDMSSLHLP